MARPPGASLRISLVGVLLAGLSLSASAATTASAATAAPQAYSDGTLAPSSAAAFVVRGSVGQVDVTDVAPGAQLALLDRSGRVVESKKANSLGGSVFYDVKPGAGYRVQQTPGGPVVGPVTVHNDRSAPWNPEIYNQAIPDHGYGYLTTRDGTQLAYSVHPPTTPAGLGTPPLTLPGGVPYPTLIEYSGYGYATPDAPENGIAVVANLMGFTVVDVNMRGSGCSGGAFNFFETLQNLDGYDVIETVARQPWVRDHKVGMMGISYGAISQLFTAQTQPPSLEAISPLSSIDATASTLYPGGLLNTGFAVAWANQRQQNAQAAGPGAGQAWAYKRVQEGDKVCAANQVLHPEAHDLPTMIRDNALYNAKVADALDPITLVHKITVPVFLACQWQDEQTGGHCPNLVSHFTGTKQKWFTFTNGAHIDSLDPETFNRWYDFLMLFVAHRAPAENVAAIRAAAPVIYQGSFGVPQNDPITLPVDPIQVLPTFDTAMAAFQAQPSVRVLFDNGAGTSPNGVATPGNPYPGYEHSFSTFPIPGTTAQQWFFGPHGALTDAKPGAYGADGFTADAKALPLGDYAGSTSSGGLWGNASQWKWDWRQNPAGTALSYVTAPLTTDTTVIGAGAVHLWVRSSTPDVDLQATITEVSPDGHETFVQNGWVRTSVRTLSTDSRNEFAQPSTLLAPILSMLAGDVVDMPTDAFVPVVVPLYYQGHPYRAGTRIRVTIAAPNGTQPIWSFSQTRPAGTAQVDIASSPTMPSSLILPVVPGVGVPTALPVCPSLRNEPCRTYVPLTNRDAGH